MFLPLHDDTPLRVIRFQFVTGALIVGNVVMFLMTGAFEKEAVFAAVAYGYGVVPAELTGMLRLPDLQPIPEPATLITYMFLHGGWLHLLSNMLFLWVFADNVEDAFGYTGFILFYLFCGIVAALIHALMNPNSAAPLIGASGAVSGVLGAYIVLYPRARIWILFLMRLPLRIPALWVLGGWFLLQVISLFVLANNDMEVALWAHIGGFLTGLIITLCLRSRLLLRLVG